MALPAAGGQSTRPAPRRKAASNAVESAPVGDCGGEGDGDRGGEGDGEGDGCSDRDDGDGCRGDSGGSGAGDGVPPGGVEPPGRAP
jgi:hypothetical protein